MMGQYVSSSMKVVAMVAMFGSFSAFAESDAVSSSSCADQLKGFTIGADLGFSSAKLKVASNKVDMLVRGADKHGSADINDHKRNSVEPSVNIGYTHIYNNWYMGVSGEFSFGKDSKKTTEFFKNHCGFSSEIGRSSFGLKAKGGYFFDGLKSSVYGIAGVKWRKTEGYVDVVLKSNKIKVGSPQYLVGIGIERPVYKKVSVSAEYEYAWRNSKGCSSAKNEDASVDLNADLRMREHNFKIGVKYHI